MIWETYHVKPCFIKNYGGSIGLLKASTSKLNTYNWKAMQDKSTIPIPDYWISSRFQYLNRNLRMEGE